MDPHRSLPRICRRGHLVADDNAYTRPNGEVQCRECRRLADRRHRMRAAGYPIAKLAMRFRERLAALEAEYGRNRCWPGPGQQKRAHKTASVSRGGRIVKGLLVHRAAYLIPRGRIPIGLVLGHLCRSPGCCNPWHVEPVGPDENNHRGDSPSAINGRKVECAYGHPFSTQNTRRYEGRRICLTCERQRRKGEPRGEGLGLQRRLQGF